MIGSTAINSICAFDYSVCLMFFIGDVDKVSQSAMPLLEVYLQATNSKTAGTVMVLMHAFIIMIAEFNIIASAMRLVSAFSKDKGLPFHAFFSQVSYIHSCGLFPYKLNCLRVAGVRSREVECL